jgi:AcrR family transcriptional regulator
VAATAVRLSASQRRSQIVDSAMPLFADLGYDRITMEAIARAAGVDKVIVYRQFGTILAVYEAALAEALVRVSAVIPILVEDERPDTEVLRADLLAFLTAVRADPNPWTVLTTAPGDPEAREMWAGVRGIVSAEVRRRVATRGEQRGMFANQRETDWMADFLFGALANSLGEHLRRHPARRDREYVEFLARFFDAIRGDEGSEYEAVRPPAKRSRTRSSK